MAEFTFMEDWDLQAVVRRGSCSSEALMINNNNNNNINDYDQFLNFPDFFGFVSNNDLDQKEVCKPFYPNQQLTGCVEVKEPEKLQRKGFRPSDHADVPVNFSCDGTSVTVKSKRSRKNQQKREVKHVKADGLACDMWAWRKYGQKPIKGSPYPRSYYRCSSLKGCLARKQVERNSTDPSTFIVTYTAEHSHAHPTRRNSLAGSTRIKSSMTKQSKCNEPNSSTIKDDKSSDNTLVQNVRIKNEEEEEEYEQVMGDIKYVGKEEIVMPDIIFSDDLFPSIEDFEGMFFDHQFSDIAP
ncbi:probable WRKY transcription factor 29 [Mercurialis annua]|uniref:probable WRKY transcription factor 29 n=1 Tax=Mercurialis annua TaxID=3986 RepID=UPI00215F4523|nr:probable WRKY transcription factor 29 [Mercurialis annua]